MSTRASDCIELAVLRVLCKRFKTGFARTILAAFGNTTALRDVVLSAKIEPSAYTDSQSFSKDYLLASFLKKWVGWKGLSPYDAAVASWTACERQNFETNLRIRTMYSGDKRHPQNFNFAVQRKIEHIIGAYPDLAVIDGLCRWSGGATFDKRRGSTICDKMSTTLTVTRRAEPHLRRVMSEDSAWNEALALGCNGRDVEIVEGNRCVTVPKTSKTDRMISAEPTGNAFLQQGVGRYFRSRLKSFGVDLDDQTVNQNLAFEARVRDLATVDLSCASDTLSLAVVELLLPPAWFELLCDLRSPKSQLNGKWYLNEKFSSMGNAFTFELESLIFYAISKVVCEYSSCPGPVSVYGDDIIIPAAAYDNLCAAFAYYGFTINLDKSYSHGSFYESCGRHYFDLEDVTPVYQKSLCGDDLFELIRLHNRLYRWGLRNGISLVKDAVILIRTRAASSHARCIEKHKHLPLVPDTVEHDLGFLTGDLASLKRDRNGDFRCLVLDSSPVVTYAIGDRRQLSHYAYKLRCSSYSAVCPDGHVGIVEGERRFLSWKRIWASSLR